MANVIRLVLSVVFGLAWIWIYEFTDFHWIVLLGSIITLCVCCCRASDEGHGEWSWDRYFRCLRRCRTALLIWMVAAILIAALWPVINGAPFPGGAVLVIIVVGSVGSVWVTRLICCLYD